MLHGKYTNLFCKSQIFFFIFIINKKHYDNQKKITLNELRALIKQIITEENLGHNEIFSLQPEGRFWVVTYRTFNDGTKEKVFISEKEAREFMKTLEK